MSVSFFTCPLNISSQRGQGASPLRRDLSIASRVWLAACKPHASFPNQMIFEGSGFFDIDLWRKAVATASAASPGSRLIVKGYLSFSSWVDSGRTPPVRIVDGSSWDGMSSEGAEMLSGSFPLRRGPMAEVLLVLGHPPKVVFRAHHAVMDGRGCFTWAENIFRALRGEQVFSTDDTLTEHHLITLTEGRTATPGNSRYLAPTGTPRGSGWDIVWKRKRITGYFPDLLSQVIMLTAREVWRHGEGTVRIAVPVDLRPRRPGLRSTGNLTNAIFIDVDPTDTVDSIAHEILSKVKNQHDGTPTTEDKLIPHLPLWVLRRLLGRETRKRHQQGAYRYSGLVSNLGKLPIEAYQGGGFVTRAIIAVPLCLESFPFSMTLCGTGDENNLVLAMPQALASGGRLEETLVRITGGLKSSRQDIHGERGVM